jgi:hypothetical protein
VSSRRLVALVSVLGCVAAGALLPAVGCNGTGTTPVCDFPDGANNPESGCGELVEAAVEDAFSEGAVEEGGPVVDSSVGGDAADASLPVDAADAGHADSGEHDAGDSGITDAHHDGPG